MDGCRPVACSVNIYIDAEASQARVAYETTCEAVYTCSNGIEVVDGNVELHKVGSCMVARSKGGRLMLSLKHNDSLRDLLNSTPVRASLPQPYPPYTVVDASIIIDSKPGLDVYGLPLRRTGVITLTQRTLLEGRSILQIALPDDIIDEVTAVVRQLDPIETSYPLLSGIESVNEVKYCEANKGYGLTAWGECINRLGGIEAGKRLTILRSLLSKSIAFEAFASRLYAGTAVNSAMEPLSLASMLLEKRQLAPIIVDKHDGVLELEGLSGTVVWFRRHEAAGVERIVGVRIEDESLILSEEYEEIAVVCRSCWEPISRFEKSRLMRG